MSEEDTGDYEACILGIWCMLITIFVLLVQIYNYVRVPSGNSFNYVSAYPAVVLTFKKIIKLKGLQLEILRIWRLAQLHLREFFLLD